MAKKEYIERGKIIYWIRHVSSNGLDSDVRRVAFSDEIARIPTADVVEVVRCKDCQYAKPYERVDGLTGYYCQHKNSTFMYGTNWERLFEPVKEADDFCSYGERRADDDNRN